MLTRHPDFDYDSVFDIEDYMYFYADSLNRDRSEAEVSALVQIAQLDISLSILDVPCGFGRHTNCLAGLGYSIVGVDLYVDYIDLACKDARLRNLTVNFCQADMRSLCFPGNFDRVLMLFTSFGYFDDEDNFRVLQSVARSLHSKGLFILDIPNRDTTVKSIVPTIVIEKGEDLMVDRISFDTITGRMFNRRIVVRNGIRKEKPFFVRLFNPSEITYWLDRAGLKVIELYSGYDGKKFLNESKRMLVVAEKIA